jgi:hypothetical protein
MTELLEQFKIYLNDKSKEFNFNEMYSNLVSNNEYVPVVLEEMLFITFQRLALHPSQTLKSKIPMLQAFIGLIKDEDAKPNKTQLLAIVVETALIHQDLDKNPHGSPNQKQHNFYT